MPGKARPARIRVRLWDHPASGAVALALPARSMRPAAIAFGIFFAIFAAVEWSVIDGLQGRSVDDVFDLTFLLFQGFWALGWGVGVVLLGALTVLIVFYSESARIENGNLVHVPKLGPLTILVDYDLGKIKNIRLERAAGGDPDSVQVRFDYDGGSNALGNAMPRLAAQRIVDAIAAAGRFVPRAIDDPAPEVRAQEPASRPVRRDVPVPLSSESVLALVIANAVPLAGVMFLGWNLGDVMVLYWVESGVIAFYTVLKIAIVGRLGALVAAPFFVGHFGGFMTAHFLLIYALFLREQYAGWVPGAAAELESIFTPIWTSIAALVISHGVSFYSNFIGEREYEGARVSALMTAPYHRVMLMHLALIAGGWIILLIGTPIGALAVLVVLKTAVDLGAHQREHAIGRGARAPRGILRRI